MPARPSGLLRRNFTVELKHERMLSLLEEHGFSRSYVVRRGIEIVYWLFRYGHDIERLDEGAIRSLPRTKLVISHFSLADKIAEVLQSGIVPLPLPKWRLALAIRSVYGFMSKSEKEIREALLEFERRGVLLSKNDIIYGVK